MGHLSRISRASRLVILAVITATIVVALAGLGRGPGPGASGATPSASATWIAPTANDATAPPATAAPATDAPSSPTSPSATNAGPSPDSSGSGQPTSLQTLLAGLAVRSEQRDGYLRSLFKLWIDADGDGCNTRKEVLIAEAVLPPVVGPSCSLSGGQWRSAYDGLTFNDSRALDIDHLVPLAEAWDSGAYAWGADRRMRFANDLGVPWDLVAVSANSNRSKGDQDPADWMPPLDSFACTYVTWWIEDKARWFLSVNPAERDALAAIVAGCPGATGVLVPAVEG